jgi:hypothetical protein
MPDSARKAKTLSYRVFGEGMIRLGGWKRVRARS